MSLIEWKFQRRQARCRACETGFAEGERHASVLSITGEEIVREDVCVRCWTKREPSQDLFYWFTRQELNRRRFQLDLATLEHLFLQLEAREEPKVRELRYILCLLLMRKRRLKLVRVAREAGVESLIVKRPRRTETCSVVVFDFTPERVDELRRELIEIFEGSEPGQLGSPAAEETRADSSAAESSSEGATRAS
jgi:hypothetical protein